MTNTILKSAALLLLLAFGHAQAAVVVIGHRDLGKVDTHTMQKIYTGKVIEVGGIKVTPVNITPSALRDRFLNAFLNQDDEKYTAYWTVRRYIGKGIPPRELDNPKAVIEFVRATPGAIGYIDEKDVSPDLNVIAP
ncbi:MAG TPA: hypothetical protein VGD24_00550 [Gallionella sp.]